jgi:agmatinase
VSFNLKKPYQPKHFLDPQDPKLDFSKAQAVIVPFGYEGTVTFGHGTGKGPQALIEASYQVETFDDELLDDVQNQIKFWTTQQPDIPKEPEKVCLVLKDIVKEILDLKKFPVVIGGEHTISFGFAQGLNEKYKDISILSFLEMR